MREPRNPESFAYVDPFWSSPAPDASVIEFDRKGEEKAKYLMAILR
jgi:hypothetical protein